MAAFEAAPLAIDVDARNAEIDHVRLRHDRLARFRAELVRQGYGAALLSDPINIRYATGARNMAIWTMHAPGRYVFVPVDGPVVLFDYTSSHHLYDDLDTVDEVRASTSPFWFLAGNRSSEMHARWATEVADLTRRARRTRPAPGRRPLRAVAGPAPRWPPASGCSTPSSAPRTRG